MSDWERQVQALLAPFPATEVEREALCRTLVCPGCAAPAGRACSTDTVDKAQYAHTGRYDLAARHGLVPELGGVR